MKNWLPKHRHLVTFVAFVLLASLACWILFIRPLRRNLEDARADLQEQTKRLLREGWPLNPSTLEDLRRKYERQLLGDDGRGGIRAQSETVVLRSTAMFDSRIRDNFGRRDDFMKAVARLDYQTHFNRVSRELAQQGVHLAPDVLQLSEDSSSPYVYQLVLHVWTLEMLAQMAIEKGLEFASVEDVLVPVGAREVAAAKVTVLPVCAYYSRLGDPDPYVLEFPVRMTLIGTLPACRQFLSSLTSHGNFLPVNHIQLYTDNPAKPEFADGDEVVVDRVLLEVECSAFFLYKRAS